MSTIEITAIEDLREGDFVTLRWEKSEGATVTVEGPMRSWAVRSAITDERFVSATREVPEWEPGTVYEITTRNADGDTERAWCVDALDPNSWHGEKVKMFVNEHGDEYAAEELTSIKPLPDDAEALRRSLEVAREGYRKEAADWRARDTRMGAEVDRLDAEVERWKAEAEMLTAKVDRLMPLQEHENECAYRQRTEKAEAEVERLEAEVKRLRDSMDTNTNFLISSNGTIWHHDTRCPHRRTMRTRKQIVDAMWPGAPESARAGMTHLDIVDRILALFEQGDES